MKEKNLNNIEHIQLLRGGGIVSSLCGSFGRSLKETRLTAMLGYLIALEPDPFLKKFPITGKIQSVSLETTHAEGRSDILIETSNGIVIVEAKIDGTNPRKQAKKYPGKWRVLITQYVPSNNEKNLKSTCYIRWRDVGELLNRLVVSSDPRVRFLSRDIKTYLEEHHMIKAKDSVEVYAREINEPNTLVLFLQSCLYGCNYEKNSRLSEALYFAPHFGQSLSYKYPGIHVGICYVARIETIETIESFSDLNNIVLKIRGKKWLNQNSENLSTIRMAISRHRQLRNFLFLGTPRLVFNPPIVKNQLQKGSGRLSKRFMSFDDLFAAWEGKLIE